MNALALHAKSAREPVPERFNMAAYVLGQAAAQPSKTALEIVSTTSHEIWSYGALRVAVLGVATGLDRIGLVAGDRVLMRIGNTLDFPIVFLAAIARGFVPVPVSAMLTRAEILTIAQQVAPKLVVAAPGVSLPAPVPCPVLHTSELVAMRDLPAAEIAYGDADRPAYIVFTSGTSGRPRGVVHAHRAVWARRMMWQGWYGLTRQDRLLHAGAFNWTYTLGTGLMDPWAIGATALVVDPALDHGALGAMLAQYSATIFAAAPGVYRQMLRTSMPPLPALRHGLSAGEKLPDATRHHWVRATGTEIYEAFGMSECSTFISGAPGRVPPAGSLGFVQDGRRVAILNEGRVGRIGAPGMIAIDRDDPGLMLGYLDDPLATARKFEGDWFVTGDIGVMDKNGAISYLGRDDDMMNAGGFRVSPQEVEATMRRCAGVDDCAAVEIEIRPDVHVIALFFTAHVKIDDAALDAHARSFLARYKQPRAYFRISELPRSANGKLLRKELRRTTPQDPAVR